MMNWIYNWYDPKGKLKVSELVENVTRLFLQGSLPDRQEKHYTLRRKRLRSR